MNSPHCPIYFTAVMTNHPKWLIGLRQFTHKKILDNTIFEEKIVFQDWRQFKKDLTSRQASHLLRISISLFDQQKLKYKDKQYEYSFELFWGNFRKCTRMSWDVGSHQECDIDFNTKEYPKIYSESKKKQF